MDPISKVNQSAVDAIGLLGAFLITVIYLYLSRRAAEAGGVPRANFILAGSMIAWTTAGVVSCLLEFDPDPGYFRQVAFRISDGIDKIFAIGWMIPVLSLWKEELRSKSARKPILALQVAVMATIGTLFFFHAKAVFDPYPQVAEPYPATYFRAAFVCLAFPLSVMGTIMLRRRATPPVNRLSLSLMLIGTVGLMLTLLLRNTATLSPLTSTLLNASVVWCPLIIITGVIVLFARFRFADRFLRRCARIVSAATLGIIAATILPTLPLPWLAGIHAAHPGPVLVAVGILVSAGLFLYVRWDGYLNLLIDRLVYPSPDYDRLLVRFQKRLLRQEEESGVVLAASDLIRSTLQMERVSVVRLSREECKELAIPFLSAGSAVVIDAWQPAHREYPGVEILAPFRIHEAKLEVLAVEPGAGRRGLVTHEMGFIQAVASRLAARLQAVHYQRSLMESRSREAMLQQQVVSAELQALRAQINPHFLFNALNTLADLIGTDAEGAERMTLRLAKVFRHVLAHSSRKDVSVREEMEFLRSYLDIEEARFSERLKVHFAIDPAANALLIPSLILQPIVENALKHGLSPRPGAGTLWITAEIHGERLHIVIEDDGMGLPLGLVPQPAEGADHGVGLVNIRRRLETQYGGLASLAIEPREPSGVRALLVLPLSSNMSPG